MSMLAIPGMVSARNYKVDKDIHYKDVEDEYTSKMCRLDVAYTGEKDVPVIVWFHGGGLTGGWREVPEALEKHNFIVVGVGYRFAPKVGVGEIVDDAAAAVAWVFKNIEKYGGDPSKIYLAGHSAGGYLVSMLGLDKKWLKAYGIDADDIAAVAPYSGQAITHFTDRSMHGIDPLTPTIDDLAPIAHMRADAPPMLIISGDREMELYGRYEENAYFVRMLRLVGHKDITFYELDGFDHGGMAQPAHPLLVKYICAREKIK